MNNQKFLIIDGGKETIPSLMLDKIYKEYGNDIIIMSPTEALSKEIKPENIAPVNAIPIVETKQIFQPPLTRRQRRENDRKNNKKQK